MKDKLKEIINSIPDENVEDNYFDETLENIVKNEIIKLWSLRVSILSEALTLVLGFLCIQEIIYLFEMLGTSGFWRFVSSESEWLQNDKNIFWEMLIQSNPVKQFITFILLILLLGFSLWFSQKIQKSDGRRSKKNYFLIEVVAIVFIAVLILSVFQLFF